MLFRTAFLFSSTVCVLLATNVLAFATPARLQGAAYARDPLGGLMRRPTRLADGCGQE